MGKQRGGSAAVADERGSGIPGWGGIHPGQASPRPRDLGKDRRGPEHWGHHEDEEAAGRWGNKRHWEPSAQSGTGRPEAWACCVCCADPWGNWR